MENVLQGWLARSWVQMLISSILFVVQKLDLIQQTSRIVGRERERERDFVILFLYFLFILVSKYPN